MAPATAIAPVLVLMLCSSVREEVAGSRSIKNTPDDHHEQIDTFKTIPGEGTDAPGTRPPHKRGDKE